MTEFVPFISEDEDSRRWGAYQPRQSDIIITTRPRCGTTWMQMIVALLVFQTPKLPLPLASLSPWMDWKHDPVDQVIAGLEKQKHRRFIKTHTVLERLPRYEGVTYISVIREPLDAIVSSYYHLQNLANPMALPSLHDWLLDWIDEGPISRSFTHDLPATLAHMAATWNFRNNEQMIVVRYEDLLADLEHQMRLIAKRLGIEVPEATWPRLVKGAGIESMRRHAAKNIPIKGFFKSEIAFFRRGGSGYAREILTETEYEHYQGRLREIVTGPGTGQFLEWAT